jgi:signal transduction histidine kinase
MNETPQNRTKHFSLRKRLISRISIFVLILAALVFTLSYFSAKHEIEEVYDAQLVQSAKVLHQLTQHEMEQDAEFNLGLTDIGFNHKYERNFAFRIWAKNELITQSQSAKIFEGFEAPPAFSDQNIENHTWRFFVLIDPNTEMKIEISERYDIRYEMIWELMLSIILPALLLIPLVCLIVWLEVRSALSPVDELAEEVDNLNTADLSAIKAPKAPQEITPFIDALNRLLARVEDSFRREREFTDHAAHELRTPLAAMKTQTQVLLKKKSDNPILADGLNNLQSALDRASHLVDQLLSLARLQHEDIPLEQINLTNIIANITAPYQKLAQNKNINFNIHLEKDIIMKGHAAYIPLLIGNLLDNAIKYTPNGGDVTLRLHEDGAVEISDTGTGLSDHDKSRVFERFVRVDKTGQTGSGLGLSIARSIAEAHNAYISLHDNHPHGLTVTITWPS